MTLTVAVLGAVLSQWPAYPGSHAIEVDLSDASHQVHFEAASYFVSDDTVAEVAAFFAARWDAQGIPTYFDGDFLQEGVVATFDLRTARQHAAVLLRLDDGRTLAFLVASRLGEFERLLRAISHGRYVIAPPTPGRAGEIPKEAER